MKQLTSYNRVAGYLNKIFDLLNETFFENELSRPTITIQSTPRAYGHFSLREDTWVSKLGGNPRNQHWSGNLIQTNRRSSFYLTSRNGSLLQLRKRSTGL